MENGDGTSRRVWTEDEKVVLDWLAQRMCFEAWIERVREPAPEPQQDLSTAA